MLHALPVAQREVIALTMDGYGAVEIAEITGQKPATVRSNLRHARRNLVAMLEREEAKHGT
jgi:RNA polymerase sigma-70 factor (ECF subfamily)